MIKRTSIIGIVMTAFNWFVDELLSTTLVVRNRLDFERTVQIDVFKECLEMTLQSPCGSNLQNWYFIIVTEFSKKRRIAEFYHQVWETYFKFPWTANRLHQDKPDISTSSNLSIGPMNWWSLLKERSSLRYKVRLRDLRSERKFSYLQMRSTRSGLSGGPIIYRFLLKSSSCSSNY